MNLKLVCNTVYPLAVNKIKLHASLLCMDVFHGTETLKSTLNKLK